MSCSAPGRLFVVAAAIAIVVLFAAGPAFGLPADWSFVPAYWLPVVFTAALAPPLQVGVLAGLCLGFELTQVGLLAIASDGGLPWRLSLDLVLAALVVIVAARLDRRRRERAHATNVLLSERRHMADVIDGLDIGIWEWNVQTGATVFNEVWAQIIGYTLAELQPVSIETWMNHVMPEDLVQSNEQLQRCFSREVDTYECEVRMRHRNGNIIWVLDRGRVVEWTDDGKPLRMLGTHRDITAQMLARQAASSQPPPVRLAAALCNEAQFETQANQELLRVRVGGIKLSVVLVDVDRLGEINADLGREAGDAVLRALADVCQQYLRGNDLLARLGGDRLGLLLPETPLGGAERVANRLVEALALVDVRLEDGRRVPFTVSVGAAEARASVEGVRGLRERAAEALDRARDAGGNKICLAA